MRKLGHTSIKQYDKGLERIETISMEMINDMLSVFANKQGQAFDPKRQVYLATANTIAQLLVGRNYGEDSEYFKLFIDLDEASFDLLSRRMEGAIMDALHYLKPFYDLLSQPAKTYYNAQNKMNAFVNAETLKSEAEGYYDSYGTVLRRAVEKSVLSEKSASYSASGIILAGSATTTNTLYAFFNILIHHPEVQRKLQKEVDDVIGIRQVTLADREHMPYHQAALLELLRFNSVAGLGVPHRSTQDTTIQGKHVPAKTIITFNHFALNHNEEAFPEPFTYKPERFLDEEGNIVPVSHPIRKHMNIFGAGPRVCFGEVLAKSRMFLITAALMQKFDIKGCGDLVSCDPREYQYKFLLYPPEYKARFIARKE